MLAGGDHLAEFFVAVGEREEGVGQNAECASAAAGEAFGVRDEVAWKAGFADVAAGEQFVVAVERHGSRSFDPPGFSCRCYSKLHGVADHVQSDSDKHEQTGG